MLHRLRRSKRRPNRQPACHLPKVSLSGTTAPSNWSTDLDFQAALRLIVCRANAPTSGREPSTKSGRDVRRRRGHRTRTSVGGEQLRCVGLLLRNSTMDSTSCVVWPTSTRVGPPFSAGRKRSDSYHRVWVSPSTQLPRQPRFPEDCPPTRSTDGLNFRALTVPPPPIDPHRFSIRPLGAPGVFRSTHH